MQPGMVPADVARLCLIILNRCDDPGDLTDQQALITAWKNASFRLEAATDQHAAVAEELEQLGGDGPIQFTPDQLWTLLRAVKVQSQLLGLYTDQPAIV